MNNAWSKQKQNSWHKLVFHWCFCFWNPGNTRRYVPGKRKRPCNWPESFERIEKTCCLAGLLTFNFRAVSRTCSWQYLRFHECTQTLQQVTLHPALAEMNTTGFIGRSIKCYSMKHLHVIVWANETIQFSPVFSSTQIIMICCYVDCHISANIST